MSDRSQVIEQLTAAFPNLSPQLRQAARYVLDRPEEVAINSMRRVAADAEVAPSTMLRLAKALGHEGYEAFRQPFRDAARRGDGGFSDRADLLQSLIAEGGGGELMGRMAAATLDNVEEVLTATRPDTYRRAADIINSAERAWVLGVGGAYGVAHYFTYVGGMVLPHLRLPRAHAAALVDSLFDLTPRDAVVAITFAPYTRETVRAFAHARARKAKTIAITDSRASPLARNADVMILAPTSSPQFFPSYTAATAAVETLLAFMVSAGDKRLIQKLAELEAFRNAMGVYAGDDGE